MQGEEPLEGACTQVPTDTAQGKVRKTVRFDPPPLTVDTTIFEMWLGRLSTHQGLSTHISYINSEGRTVISNICT